MQALRGVAANYFYQAEPKGTAFPHIGRQSRSTA
jgi:hypothetical protein